jgi:uncharacterized protein (TIGR02996 family)
MTTATDGAGLLEDILANPGDDVTRLVYADWLEESGEAERAALARLPRLTLEREGSCWVPALEDVFLSDCRDEAARVLDALPAALWPDGSRATLRHGFVDEVRCPLGAWTDHGPAVVRAHPVTRAELTDAEPWRSRTGEGVFAWNDREDRAPGSPDELPGWLYALLAGHINDRPRHWKRYRGREAALDALSDALIRWANLPPERRG